MNLIQSLNPAWFEQIGGQALSKFPHLAVDGPITTSSYEGSNRRVIKIDLYSVGTEYLIRKTSFTRGEDFDGVLAAVVYWYRSTASGTLEVSEVLDKEPVNAETLIMFEKLEHALESSLLRTRSTALKSVPTSK